MIKQIVMTGFAAAALLLSAQVSAHQPGHGKVWKSHSHKVTKQVTKSRRQVVQRPKFNVNREQRHQALMIKQGIRQCQITPREARVLNKMQKNIKRTERRMRKNGLQRWEVKQLKRSLHNARVKINRLSNNHKTCGRSHRRGYKSNKRGNSGRYHH